MSSLEGLGRFFDSELISNLPFGVRMPNLFRVSGMPSTLRGFGLSDLRAATAVAMLAAAAPPASAGLPARSAVFAIVFRTDLETAWSCLPSLLTALERAWVEEPDPLLADRRADVRLLDRGLALADPRCEPAEPRFEAPRPRGAFERFEDTLAVDLVPAVAPVRLDRLFVGAFDALDRERALDFELPAPAAFAREEPLGGDPLGLAPPRRGRLAADRFLELLEVVECSAMPLLRFV
jgi:hypothetical protein